MGVGVNRMKLIGTHACSAHIDPNITQSMLSLKENIFRVGRACELNNYRKIYNQTRQIAQNITPETRV